MWGRRHLTATCAGSAMITPSRMVIWRVVARKLAGREDGKVGLFRKLNRIELGVSGTAEAVAGLSRRLQPRNPIAGSLLAAPASDATPHSHPGKRGNTSLKRRPGALSLSSMRAS
jgi:hypothetical protein